MPEKKQIKIRFLGALDCVTGSSTLLEFKSENIKLRYLIDLGLIQNDPIQTANDEIIKLASSLDGIFITHSHADHIGRLPLLLDNGFNGKIYLTKATADISQIMLEDQLTIENVDISTKIEIINSFKNKIVKIDDKESFVFGKTYIPLYNDFQFMPLRSSHILGACSYAFRWTEKFYDEDINNLDKKWIYLYFSGDLGPNMFGKKPNYVFKNNQTIFHDGLYKYIVMESTYGDRKRDEFYSKYRNRLNALSKYINDCQIRGDKLIIPTFSLDRAQQILTDINVLHQNQEIYNKPFSQKKIKGDTLFSNDCILNFIYKIAKSNLENINGVVKDLSTKAKFENNQEIITTKNYSITLENCQNKWNEFIEIWERNNDRKFEIKDLTAYYRKLPEKLKFELCDLENRYALLDPNFRFNKIPVYLYSNLANKINSAYIDNLSDTYSLNNKIEAKYLSKDYLEINNLEIDESTLKENLYSVLNVEDTNLSQTKKYKKNENNNSQGLNKFLAKSIIVTSSGMVDNGKIISLLKEALTNKNITILLTGYQSPNTNGYLLKHINDYTNDELYNKKIIIDENNYIRLSDVKCHIEDISSYYSGHADQEQLVNYATWPINETNRTVFLTHGDSNSRKKLQNEILKKKPKIDNVILPFNTNKWYILKSNGKFDIEEEPLYSSTSNIEKNLNNTEIKKINDNNIKIDLSINIDKSNFEKLYKLIKEIVNS